MEYNYIKLHFKIVLSVLFASFAVKGVQAQCPLVSDTIYVFNPELPYANNFVYLSYLEPANAAYTDNYWANANSEYVWPGATNAMSYRLESRNAVYLDGAGLITATAYTYNLNVNLTASAGNFTDGGAYLTSPINTSSIVDRVVEIQLQQSFFGLTSFPINYQSCDWYTYMTSHTYSGYAYYSSLHAQGASTYSISTQTYFLSTYACGGLGGVCSAYGTSLSYYTYITRSYSIYQTYTSWATQTGIVTISSRCQNNAFSPRQACQEQIYLYIQRPTDVAVTKTCAKSIYGKGEQISFKVEASSNLYGADIDSITVTDILPAGLQMTSYTITGGSYDHITGVWALPTMGDGRVHELNVTAIALVTGDYINTATLSNNDADYSNNTASCGFYAEGYFVKDYPDPANCDFEISAQTGVCSGDNVLFSIPSLPDASYLWEVPSGYTIASGQGTNIIDVQIGSESDYVEVLVTWAATDSTMLTTCERSIMVNITSETNDLRIR